MYGDIVDGIEGTITKRELESHIREVEEGLEALKMMYSDMPDREYGVDRVEYNDNEEASIEIDLPTGYTGRLIVPFGSFERGKLELERLLSRLTKEKVVLNEDRYKFEDKFSLGEIIFGEVW